MSMSKDTSDLPINDSYQRRHNAECVVRELIGQSIRTHRLVYHHHSDELDFVLDRDCLEIYIKKVDDGRRETTYVGVQDSSRWAITLIQ